VFASSEPVAHSDRLFSCAGRTMRELTALILMACLGLCLTGCGSDRDKNINKDKDKPVPPEKKQIAN
jgi:hypothetical protein